jgi:hypothetical protein
MKKNRSAPKKAVRPAVKKAASNPSAAKSTRLRIPIAIGELPEYVDSTTRLASMVVGPSSTVLTDGDKLAIIRHSSEIARDKDGVAVALEPGDVSGLVRLARRRNAWASVGLETLTLDVPDGQKVANAVGLAARNGEGLPSARIADKPHPTYEKSLDRAVSTGTMPVRFSVRNLRAVVELLERCGVSQAEIMLFRHDAKSVGLDSMRVCGPSSSLAISSVLSIVSGIAQEKAS